MNRAPAPCHRDTAAPRHRSTPAPRNPSGLPSTVNRHQSDCDVFTPTGQNVIARGNVPGNPRKQIISPEGARFYASISGSAFDASGFFDKKPGTLNRRRYSRRTSRLPRRDCRSLGLTVIAPLQGLTGVVGTFLGRCPRLSQCPPSGRRIEAQLHRKKGSGAYS